MEPRRLAVTGEKSAKTMPFLRLYCLFAEMFPTLDAIGI
jgi:hypothetical protein